MADAHGAGGEGDHALGMRGADLRKLGLKVRLAQLEQGFTDDIAFEVLLEE